jgi:hypothetical protein
VTALLEEDQARVRVAPALLLSPTNGRLADLRTRALLPFPATYPELRAASYATLIGLLAATGMRIGEAIRRGDPPRPQRCRLGRGAARRRCRQVRHMWNSTYADICCGPNYVAEMRLGLRGEVSAALPESIESAAFTPTQN